MPRFGEQRLLRGALERWYFRVFGVADPSHYLHHRYLVRALSANPVRPSRILDAGSGSGDHAIWLARSFPDAQVLGVDIDEDCVKRASSTARDLGVPNVEFRPLDLGEFDLSGFDLINSIDVLEHVPDQRDVLRRLTEGLAPGGLAFYHVPTERPKPVLFASRLAEFHAWADEAHVDDDLAPEEFVSRVAASGLDVLQWEPTFGRWTGEAACSLFAMPYRNTLLNRAAQVALAPACRGLALADPWGGGVRYAVAVTARRPAD